MPDRLRSTGKNPLLTYGRAAYRRGEEFIATPSDAKTLVSTGLAERVGEDEVPALLMPPMREPTLEEVAAVVVQKKEFTQADIDPPKRKRGRPRKNTYSTRDLRADE